MRIWLIKIGEPLPLTEPPTERLFRTGHLARLLAKRGHQVTWWTSTFDHYKKKHVFRKDSTLELIPGLTIRFLKACGYSRNVSLNRYREHRIIAEKYFSAANAEMHPPDVILSAWPTVELSTRSVEYGRLHNVPVIIDIRDMVPDIYINTISLIPRPLLRIVFAPLFQESRRTLSQVSGIISITDELVEWGLKAANRVWGEFDRCYAHGYEAPTISKDKLEDAKRFWDGKGVDGSSNKLLVCFLGALDRTFEMKTVISAARILQARKAQVRFMICGSGNNLKKYRSAASGLSNMMFPGWVNAAQLFILMQRSSVGLNPLPDRFDFNLIINNKPIEYMSAGLPVISSPRKGVLYKLLKDHGCGLSYNPRNPGELVQILTDLSLDPARIETMSQNSQRLFQERFTAEKVYNNMADYLEKIAQKPFHLYSGGES